MPFANERHGVGHYRDMLHLVFDMGGLDVRSQVRTSQGVIDMLVFTTERLYVIELKLDRSARVAIRRMEEKGYARVMANAHPGLEVHEVGIGFSSRTRTVASFLVVLYEGRD